MKQLLFLTTILISLSFQGDLQEKEIAEFSQKIFNSFHYQERSSFEKLILSIDELESFVESNDEMRDREKERFIEGYQKDFEKQDLKNSLVETFETMIENIKDKNLQGQLKYLNYNVSLYEAGMENLYGGELVIGIRMGKKTDYIIVQLIKGPFGYRIYGDLYCKSLLK